MNCENNNAPVDINPSTIQGSCSLKCYYNFKYGETGLNIINEEYYLNLEPTSGLNGNQVEFNKEKLSLRNARIYTPSLHRFGGVQTEGELVLFHGGNGKNLIVCVPLVKGTKDSLGSMQLSNILNEAALRTPNPKESASLSLSRFSFNNLVPSKPFYSYKGKLLVDPCNSEYDYVVFNKEDGIFLSQEFILKLKKIVKENYIKTNENEVFFNEKGPNLGDGENDDIYIDCQPVNEEGVLLVDEGKHSGSSDGDDNWWSWENIKKSKIFILIVALLIVIVAVKIFRFLMGFITGTRGGGNGEPQARISETSSEFEAS